MKCFGESVESEKKISYNLHIKFKREGIEKWLLLRNCCVQMTTIH